MKPEQYAREYLEQIVRGVMLQTAKPDFTIPAVPVSDNQRKTRNPTTGRMVTNAQVGVFKKHVAATLMAMGKGTKVPLPPVVVLYRIFFKNRRRDSSNCTKTLLDALYKQDKHVRAWDMAPGVDAKNPRVEVWIVRLPEEGDDGEGKG